MRRARECHRKRLRRRFIAVDRSIVAVNEDVDLADASSRCRSLHIVGLSDENVSRDSGARGDGCTRRPRRCWYHIFENRSAHKTNLDAILRRTAVAPIPCDNIPTNNGDSPFFVGGDAVL